MDRAGYLFATTAKREDCILSYVWFLHPICELLRQGNEVPDFYGLLAGGSNEWQDKILATSRRHRFRGVTAEMFIGCFKTLVLSIEEMVLEGGYPPDRTLEALRLIRGFADALETRIVGDWTAMSEQEANERLDASNRSLTLEKNTYENILGVISDLVLVVDKRGLILEINRAAAQVVPLAEIKGRPIWAVLGVEASSMEDMLQAYPEEFGHEIEASFDPHYFEMRLAPLNRVSLASSSHLVVLRDISTHVRHREILESTVQERTSDLKKEKAQLEEMNITMRNVLKTIDNELEAYKRRTTETIKAVLLPALKRARSEVTPGGRKAYLSILEDQLLDLCQGGADERNPLLLKLSPTELRICEFIQAGSSTKTIADALNLSEGTVKTHRKNIRKKLNIQNQTVNLYSFLQHGGKYEADTNG